MNGKQRTKEKTELKDNERRGKELLERMISLRDNDACVKNDQVSPGQFATSARPTRTGGIAPIPEMKEHNPPPTPPENFLENFIFSTSTNRT